MSLHLKTENQSSPLSSSHSLASITTIVAPSTPTQHHHELTDQTNLLPFKQLVMSFFGLSLCMVVSTLDSVIVATTIPTIASAFNAGSVVSWVPAAYLLTTTGFLPLYGRFSDIFGRKPMMIYALSIFMLGNLLAGFSRSIIQLIVLRGLAGVGGGGILTMASIIISDIISLRDRGKYQGIIGSVIALGYAIGPLAGGTLAEKASWRWCFWINIPLGLVAVCVVIFVLPLKPVHGDIKEQLLLIDYAGSGLTLISCTLIILPLIWGGITFPWKSPIVISLLVSGFISWILFGLWEWKGARLPIIPMHIFKHRTVCGVYITTFINGFINLSSMFYLPQFFQTVLRYGPIHAALILIPLLVIASLSSFVAGLTISLTGKYKVIICSGFTIWSISCGMISTLTMKSHVATLVAFMLSSGIGSGQTSQTTTVALQASLPRKDIGVATAVRNFIRMLGGTLSLAVSATLINNILRSSMKRMSLPTEIFTKVLGDPTILANPASYQITTEDAMAILEDGYTRGFRLLFRVNAGLSVIAALTSILLIEQKSLIRGDEEELRAKNRKKECDIEGGSSLSGDSPASEKPCDSEGYKVDQNVLKPP